MKNLGKYIRYGLFLFLTGWLFYEWLLFNGSIKTKLLYLLVGFMMVIVFAAFLDVELNPGNWLKEFDEDEKEAV